MTRLFGLGWSRPFLVGFNRNAPQHLSSTLIQRRFLSLCGGGGRRLQYRLFSEKPFIAPPCAAGVLFSSSASSSAAPTYQDAKREKPVIQNAKLKQSDFLLKIEPGQAPLIIYQEAVISGLLHPDESQVAAVQLLNDLYNTVLDQEMAAKRKSQTEKSFFSKAFAKLSAQGEDAKDAEEKPKGLYFWGGVGCGKTMLMDLFFKCVPIKQKRRLHLNALLMELFQQMHEMRQMRPKDDVMALVMDQFTSECKLLCLDELQLYDVGNLMMVRTVFDALFKRGLTVICTSNRKPESISFNVHHSDLEPLTKLFTANCIIHRLASETDYRFLGTKAETYFFPLDDSAAMEKAEQVFETLVGPDAEPERISLEVQGHVVNIPWAVTGIARFTFKHLCGMELAAPDYIAIADAFPTIMITDIPVMSPVDSSEARRFITLIDTCYEKKVKILITAEAPPTKIFVVAGTEVEADCFATVRTISRLMEMQTEQYMNTAWR